MGAYITAETCIISGISSCGKLLCFIHSKKKEKKQKQKEKKQKEKENKELYKQIHKSIDDNLEKKFLLTRRRSSRVLLPPIIKEGT